MESRVTMDMGRRRGRWLAVALLVAAGPAQATLGNGIRVGGADGRLHPFVELELRYDSNAAAFYQPYLSSAGDLILHLRPGLLLTVPGDSLAVDMRAALDWAQYFGITDSATKDLSNLYADFSLGLGFNRKGQVGLELDEKFTRSNQPYSYSVASGVVSNYNDLLVKVPWRPGGGALTLALAGGWAIESYEAFKTYQVCGPSTGNPFCNSAYLSDLGYNHFSAGLGANWKFLPKTAALLDLSWFDRVPNSTLYSLGVSGMRVQAGASGLVTSHLAATLKAGYGTTLNLSLDPAAGPVPPSLGTWLATVSAEWNPSELSSLKLTWTHDLGVDPGIVYALYTVTHITLDGKMRFNTRLAGVITGDYALLSYRDPSSTSTIITVKPALQAEMARWLMLELAYQYTDRTTDLAVPPPGWKYSKNEIWLRGVVTY
jgi:hypothetical protein